MSNLDNNIKVVISRETDTISRAGFGVPAIISEFSDAKISGFGRHRYYSDPSEMLDDGFTTFDREYKAAQILTSQEPKVSRFMIGRQDPGDASLTVALTAIQAEQQDWYAFMILATKTAKVVFDADLITDNDIDMTINGVAITQVPFNTDHDTTMTDLKTQIETDITNSTVTLLDTGGNNRDFTIEITDTTPSISSAVVTGGASQAIAALSFDDTGVDDLYKEAAAWSETQVKIFFYSSSNSDIILAPTTDIFSFMQGQNYDRTVQLYHPNSQTETIPAWIEAGQMGEALPFDPGSQTWKFKTPKGVASYSLTSGQSAIVIGTIDNPTGGKNGNTFTRVAGVDIIENGQVASGEYIDVIRGLDDLKSAIQENIFALFTSNVSRKVPFTDGGITTHENTLKGVLNNKADQGIITTESISVTSPKVADVPTPDKAARNLPNVKWGATLQGAIHSSEIDGTVVL